MLLGTLSHPVSVVAQEKCATVPYQKQLSATYPGLETTEEFENWLQEKIRSSHAGSGSANREQLEIITIPVVVHVIHFGEAVGVGRNIPNGQIISQIDVLNEDFRRNNADASNTPAEFLPVVADIEIEFVLAKQDPEGLPTSGINRIQGNKASYKISDHYEMKSLSYWPAEDYLNIWVADLGENFLGFAQFPVSPLGGLEDASNYALTDGISIDYTAFGSVDKYPAANLSSQYNLGRTTTHEVGHYLGLRHIWGDSNVCGPDDFCADTPETNTSHSGLGSPCTFPAASNGCGSNDMFQNYMDYTDDGCMNLFTQDQKDRMRVVLDNSPRRISIKTSKGGQAPVVVANDLGIRSILDPGVMECTTLLTPVLVVRNYGSNAVTSSIITLKLDGNVVETKSSSHALNTLDLDTLSFSPLDLATIGSHQLEWEILTVNGFSDDNPDNNLKQVTTIIPASTGLPVAVDFETFPTDWIIQDIDEVKGWQIVTAPNGNPSNQALSINFYDYEQRGELDLFLSPVVDLSNVTSAALSFDVAYAQFSGVTDEGLVVTVSGMCGDTFEEADTVFSRFGSALASKVTNSYFTPSGPDDWQTYLVDLSSYAGSEHVRISFIGKNDFGNNIYLDNIRIANQDLEDIALAAIHSPSRVSCQTVPTLEFTVQNVSQKPIGYFEINYTLDGATPQLLSWQNIDSLLLGEEVVLSIPLPEIIEGGHQIELAVANPNGILESNTDNNSQTYRFVIDTSEDIAPIKETFETTGAYSWVVANPDGSLSWEVSSTNKGNSIVVKGSQYEALNEKDWLVSPSLDFTQAETVSLNFNVAYATGSNGIDGLTVLISYDCGETYDQVVYSKSGETLSTASAKENFVPDHDSLWRNEEVNLAYLAGQSDIRIAFVSTTNNGNNIYLDDIQVYVTQHDNIVANTLYPNPTYNQPVKLAFDLDQKETVNITVYDRSGHVLLEWQRPNTLNQTYTMDLSTYKDGIYIVKVVGQSFSFTKRLMLIHEN